MNPPEPRILMTTDAVGGVWTYSTALARELCATGYAVTLVTLGPRPSPEQLAALEPVRGLAIEVTDLALEWIDLQGDDVARACEEFRRIAARVRPDLVHINGYREALYGFNAPVLVVAHSCVGSWWEACRPGVPIEPTWRAYLDRVRDALDAADVWVAPTHAYRNWIATFYRPHNDGEVVWNGVAPMQPAARKEHVVLAAGRVWDDAKNLSALASIASRLPWPVRLAGPASNENGEAVRLHGVIQLGALPHAQLIADMQKAAIFVSPAVYEPFGLGVLEAAASGCALVLADIPTFRELWHDAALFVDPRDDTALAEALTRLCHDETMRRALQRKAEKRARRYSLQATVDSYRSLYNRLMLSPQLRDMSAPAFAEACG